MGSDTSVDTSVVIPVWDAYVDARLDTAVRSIQDQGWPVDIILVDNASTVPLPPFPDTRQVSAPHRLTLGASRNFGLRAVTTPYVVFWDSDDVMPPGTLHDLHQAMGRADDTVAAATAMHHPLTGKRYPFPPRWAYRLAPRPRLFALCHTVRPLYPGLGSVLMRTAVVREVGGYDDTDDGGEDWALTSALAFRGRIVLTHHPGRSYLATPDSRSSRQRSLFSVWSRRCRVRRRLRADPGLPAAGKRLLPLLAVVQWFDVVLFRILRQLLQKANGTVTGPILTNSKGSPTP
ncbi:glycosyltransferase family 2 protein [Streptomyces sp. NPDC057743]|uniref:glycosyltransferase family 2 protein n=1 Tax=Streptomyces sp. NPDC057743 TaxID=3346236 RepID=UPI0036CB8492